MIVVISRRSMEAYSTTSGAIFISIRSHMPEYGETGSYQLARWVSTDKRVCVYQRSFTWTKSRYLYK